MIFTLIGKSASGKDAIIKEISKRLNMPIALSFTTRPKRENETQYVEYEFISDMDFKMKLNNNEIAEFTTYNVATNETWYYGLSKYQLEKSENVLVIVNPHGSSQLQDIYGDKVVSILIEVDDKTRLLRSINREENPNCNELCRRFLCDQEDFKNVLTDYTVYNDTLLEESVNQTINIIKGELV